MGWLFLLMVGGLASLGAIGLLRRPRLGRLVVTTDDARSFSFVTDAGRFRIEREKHELSLRAGTALRSIPLIQVERFDFAHEERWSGLEEALRGVPAGLLGNPYFAERLRWVTLSIVLAGGESLPLYAIAELNPPEPWLRSIFEIESALWARLGMSRDIEQTAQKALERIRTGFAHSGAPVGLG